MELKSTMKHLGILNKINTAFLGAYFVYFLIGANDFFISKEQNGVVIVAIIMFLTTFICGGVTLFCAGKSDVVTGIKPREMLTELKSSMLFWGVICIVEAVILIIFFHNIALIWCIGVLVLSFIFVIMERIVIPQIIESTSYKISLPWYVYPLPFVLFVGGNIYLANSLSEDMFEKVAIPFFILCGIIMASIAWHGYYKVDEGAGTIERNYGIISVFKKNKDIVPFDSIRCIEKKGIYYILYTNDDKAIKISRLYSGTKRFKKTLADNSIIITN